MCRDFGTDTRSELESPPGGAEVPGDGTMRRYAPRVGLCPCDIQGAEPAPPRARDQEDHELLPSVSIVIPTYSRPGHLADCLRSLARLDYPRDRLEVIVVDDGGDAPLEDVVAPFGSDLALSLHRQRNAGPAAARNAGAELARGEYLAFTDDDCLPEPGWLKELVGVLSRNPESMVGGTTVNAASSLYFATSQLIVDVVYRHYNADPQAARFISSNNMAMSARGFGDIGGFDPAFRAAEDRELCDRWRHRGRRIIHVSTARVGHARPMNARGFCRQHFHYGRGAEQFRRKRAQRRSGSMLAESRFHLDVRNWLWYPLTRVPARQIPQVAGLLGLWQTTNLAGFAWEVIRRNTNRLWYGALSISD